MRIAGIDPGLTGAISVFDPEAGTLDIIDMPTTGVKVGKVIKQRLSEPMLAELLRARNIQFAALELVNAMPGQGVSSMFQFGVSYGAIRGVLAGLRIKTENVTPQRWQKDLKLVRGKGKEASRQRAAELFPAYAASFVRVKDDGRADAALLAYWLFCFGNCV
jgi:crossover junction endodeoxyribonuclease RuvC